MLTEKCKKIFVVAGLLTALGGGSRAHAFATGTIWIPNDKVEPGRDARWDSRVFFTLDKRSSDTGPQEPFIDEGLTYGIFENATVGLEGGFDWWEPESQDNLKCLHAHFKFAVLEQESFPGIVLGFYNFGFKSNTTDENILYLGLGKGWSGVGHFFIGYSVGNASVLEDERGNPANSALLLSYEHPSPFPFISRNLALAVDAQSSNSREGALSFGLKYWFRPDSALLFGYDIMNNHYLSRDLFNIQLLVRL